MSDVLKNLPVEAVAAWYRRLADSIGRARLNGEEPLSSRLLRHYLENREPNSTYSFEAPSHLRNSSWVFQTLTYHRRVFLTEERARFTGGSSRWSGVVPRLQGRGQFIQWHPGQPLKMIYQSLVEIPLWIQISGTNEEKDLLTAFHGFQLKSEVLVQGTFVPNSTRARIFFSYWGCKGIDRYDFDFSEHFTVPNPDYGSSLPGAVEPLQPTITVFHSNARRLELAHLAAPFNIETKWQTLDLRITSPADVDWSRDLESALAF